jgi:hypothetical protein
MELVEIYSAIEAGEVTLSEAAKLFGMGERTLKFRLTRWGHRLPLLLSVLDKIRKNQISRDEAAEALGVSTREINALCVTWNVSRPVAKHRVMRAAAGIKRELRKKYAIDYIAGTSTVEDAAAGAQCSERQLRRWVSELLQKHHGMV